jgi:hypothetical protein
MKGTSQSFTKSPFAHLTNKLIDPEIENNPSRGWWTEHPVFIRENN